MLSPTLYASLINRATVEPQKDIEAKLKEHADYFVGGLASQIAESMGQVYAAGVADGFAQGVAAVIEQGERTCDGCARPALGCVYVYDATLCPSCVAESREQHHG